MPTYTATVDEQGQVRLPQELRARLMIAPGDRVEFFATLDGHVYVHAINRSWQGIGSGTGPHHRPGLSMREIDDAIADHVAADDARIRAQSPAEVERSAAE